jgi:type IV pilus assembly protein PilA
MKKLNKKGFTLIELIVVIAILAILAAILIPAVTGYIAKATNAKDAANSRALYSQTAMELLLGNTVTLQTADVAHDLDCTYTANALDATQIATFTCDGANLTFSMANNFEGE